jgi:hypothetical protein
VQILTWVESAAIAWISEAVKSSQSWVKDPSAQCNMRVQPEGVGIGVFLVDSPSRLLDHTS